MHNNFDLDSDSQDEAVISEINITPLVDVMLLLMVIFLVTAPLMVNNLNINLPNAKGKSSEENINKTISINKDGQIFFDSKEVSQQQLNEELARVDASKTSIKLAIDKESQYQNVATILSILHQNKISNISFLTNN